MSVPARLADRRVARIASELGCTVEDVYRMLDEHPLNVDRVTFMRRLLVIELLNLDALEMAFHAKAIDGDVASGTLVVKIAERRATLLGLNPPVGSSVTLIAHEAPPRQETTTQQTERILDEIMGRSDPNSGSDGTAH